MRVCTHVCVCVCAHVRELAHALEYGQGQPQMSVSIFHLVEAGSLTLLASTQG